MMLKKSDLYMAKLHDCRREQGREALDYETLLRLRPLDRVAELLSLDYTNDEIAGILNYGSAASVNAQVQRLRGKLGWQAA